MSAAPPKTPADPGAALHTAVLGAHMLPVERFCEVMLIGRGSMGVVYRAYDTTRRQTVAVKTLRALDPEQVYWLKNEFRLLADVRHRNLVELHDLRVTDRSCLFTMELVDGVEFPAFVQELLAPTKDIAGGAEARLAQLDDVIAQLVGAVKAIHVAGKLHRDIKPSNVLVARDGRVVVLDFGLALPLERASDTAEHATLVGTPLYMAPEQMIGGAPSPASDWYALGVVLFEALAGCEPFDGAYSEVFERKRRTAPDVRARNPDVPEHLATLVTALLDPEPQRRPDAERILDLLATPSGRVLAAPVAEHFLGREAELDLLTDCFGRARAATVVVHVQGESGIGKTALLQHFVARVASRDDALVLRGRCHPRESVPYKALDGVVDHLTAVLLRDRRLADVIASAASPSLGRLFPVLDRLRPDLPARAAEPLLDPVEARRAGAEVLARILHEIAAIRPLVLWIDDLQWGDADSAAVLRAILSAESPPPMLVLLSYRPQDTAQSPLLNAIVERPLEGRASRVASLLLAPLAPPQAAALALRIMMDEAADAAAEIAQDSGGSPFFIRELARHRRAAGDLPAGRPRLEQILSRRLAALPNDARHLLELVSLAATTLTTRDTVDASARGGEAWSLLRLLEGEGLVRLSPLGPDQGVEPYHDRIRESVVASIDPGALAERHRLLADVLERSPRRDPEALLTHHLAASNFPAALQDARLAAERAASALAFDRAATHYRTALDLVRAADDRLPLLIALAEALNSAGRTGEAADRFLEATRLAESAHVEPLRLRRLRRRAGECLLRSGRSAEGREILWSILRAVGASLPRSERDALLRGTIARLPLLVGPLPRPRAQPKPLGAAARERLDVLWAAAICLSWEPVTASYFRARYIREALPTNEPLLVAAALGAEAASQGAMRWAFPRRRGDRLLARMEDIARTLDDPYTTAHAASVRAHNAFFCGRWREALESGDREIELLRRHCHGVSWELAVAQIFSLLALSFLGDMRTLRTRLDAALLDATERGDQFAARNLRLGQHNFCKLASDDVDELLAGAEALGREMSRDRFEVQHYHHVVLVTQCHLYRGDALAAWRAIDGVWARLKAAQFLQLAFTSVELVHLRARAALALAADRRRAIPPRRDAPEPRELVRLVTRASAAIRRSDAPPAAPLAASLDAGLARLRGDHEQASGHLAAAERGFAHADMGLHAAAARWAGAAGARGGHAGAPPPPTAGLELADAALRPHALAATLLPAVVA